MSIDRKIEDLTEELQKKLIDLLDQCKDKGINVKVSETKRDICTQAVYYLRGRVDTSDKNIIEAIQELGKRHAWEFNAAEVGQKVTWTMESKHIQGKAFDLEVYSDKGNPMWNYDCASWKEVYKIARSLDLECGADWEQRDGAHFQLKD